MKKIHLITIIALTLAPFAKGEGKLKALIVDGQNNHAVWPKSTIMMREYLRESGLFDVDVARSRYLWKWEREESWLELAGTGESEKLKKPQADPDHFLRDRACNGLHHKDRIARRRKAGTDGIVVHLPDHEKLAVGIADINRTEKLMPLQRLRQNHES